MIRVTIPALVIWIMSPLYGYLSFEEMFSDFSIAISVIVLVFVVI
jgi:hypothetical protein